MRRDDSSIYIYVYICICIWHKNSQCITAIYCWSKTVNQFRILFSLCFSMFSLQINRLIYQILVNSRCQLRYNNSKCTSKYCRSNTWQQPISINSNGIAFVFWSTRQKSQCHFANRKWKLTFQWHRNVHECHFFSPMFTLSECTDTECTSTHTHITHPHSVTCKPIHSDMGVYKLNSHI